MADYSLLLSQSAEIGVAQPFTGAASQGQLADRDESMERIQIGQHDEARLPTALEDIRVSKVEPLLASKVSGLCASRLSLRD